MTLDIIRAEPSDAAAVALLGRITFAETFAHLFHEHRDDLRTYLDATFDVAKIERSLGKPENTYWAACRNELLIGYAKLKYPSAPPGKPGRDVAQLLKIYVLREFLGDGIGRALMAPMLHAASGLASLIWLDVLSQNERAISFHTKLGFAAIGDGSYTIGSQRFLFHLMARPPA
jgi:ribosomal protein S18 acetylase RimI-like enzyme